MRLILVDCPEAMFTGKAVTLSSESQFWWRVGARACEGTYRHMKGRARGSRADGATTIEDWREGGMVRKGARLGSEAKYLRTPRCGLTTSARIACHAMPKKYDVKDDFCDQKSGPKRCEDDGEDVDEDIGTV